jgi:hypothetical protein
MRMILMALTLGISVAAVASPALAAPDETDGNRTDLGTVEKILAQSDRDTPQIGVSVVAGSDEQRPLVQQWRYENQEGH